MTETVRAAHLHQLLAVIDAVRTSVTPAGLPTAALDLAGELVPCDIVSFAEDAPARQQLYLDQNRPDAEYHCLDPAAFYRHYWASTYCSYPARSGDLTSVCTISDFYTARQWHSTGMYADYHHHLGVEAEVALCLSAPTGRIRRLSFLRGPGPDFDGRDRLLLALLRPYLNETYQELVRRRRPVPDLTTRQWELLTLLAQGRTNMEIADHLVVSVTTVRKHLENIFQRLDVTNRTAAIAKAFPAPPY